MNAILPLPVLALLSAPPAPTEPTPEGPATACFDRNVEVYREGAAGANGGKSGGGCGCT